MTNGLFKVTGDLEINCKLVTYMYMYMYVVQFKDDLLILRAMLAIFETNLARDQIGVLSCREYLYL